jgi:Protein of unknown function (DUF3486)
MPQRSSISLLPEDIRAWLNTSLIDNAFSGYQDLADALAEKGYEISRSSIHRYGVKFEAQLAELKEATEQALALADACGDDENALGDALTRLTQMKAYQALMEMSDVKDLSLPQLGRMVADLNRSSVTVKKYSAEVRKKLEEKLKILEAEAIKAGGEGDENPHLKTLKRVREEVYGLF